MKIKPQLQICIDEISKAAYPIFYDNNDVGKSSNFLISITYEDFYINKIN